MEIRCQIFRDLTKVSNIVINLRLEFCDASMEYYYQMYIFELKYIKCPRIANLDNCLWVVEIY